MTMAIDGASTAAPTADWPEPLIIERGPAALFGEPDEAWFNEARTHRYLLTRRWGDGEPMNIIGLNPSTADAFTGDPTIGRVVGFARREGFGWVRMLNIYGLMFTDPGLLWGRPDRVGLCGGPDTRAVRDGHCRGRVGRGREAGRPGSRSRRASRRSRSAPVLPGYHTRRSAAASPVHPQGPAADALPAGDGGNCPITHCRRPAPATVLQGDRMDTAELADAAEQVAALALRFGEIERTACEHPDGRPETDATHTVMLAWLAPALAALLYPDTLDAGLVAQFAIMHDAVEVFAGDTPTLRITAEERAAKREREQAAALQWRDAFLHSLPWVPNMIARYEDQAEPEARFVRAVDKCCPALTHMSNGAADVGEYGITADEVNDMRCWRRAEMAEYAGEFTAILDLRDELSARLAAMLRKREAKARTGRRGRSLPGIR